MRESPKVRRNLTAAASRDQRARVWRRTRKALEAACVPPGQESSLARAARRDLRLTRAAEPRSTYHSKTYPGLVLRCDRNGHWGWASKGWSDSGRVERVGSYRTQRAALAAWAAANQLEHEN